MGVTLSHGLKCRVLPWLVLVGGGQGAPLSGIEGRAEGHENSTSFSRVEVNGATVQRTLWLQAASLLEVIPMADRNGDGLLKADELSDDLTGQVESYVGSHFQLVGFAGNHGSERDVLLCGQSTLSALEEGVPGEWLLLRSELATASNSKLKGLLLEMDLFARTSPDHQDHGLWLWNDAQPFDVETGPQVRAFAFEPPERSTALGMGIESGIQRWVRRWEFLALLTLAGCWSGLLSLGARRVWLGLAAAVGWALGWAGLWNAPSEWAVLACPLVLAYLPLDSHLRGNPHEPGIWETCMWCLGLLWMGTCLVPTGDSVAWGVPEGNFIAAGEALFTLIGLCCVLWGAGALAMWQPLWARGLCITLTLAGGVQFALQWSSIR